jgi:precorrin-6Y C5,15-methyltransferase (decarboxylating)
MGGIHERILTGTAANWNETDIAALNTIAVECIADW